jgi:hypothetical protein
MLMIVPLYLCTTVTEDDVDVGLLRNKNVGFCDGRGHRRRVVTDLRFWLECFNGGGKKKQVD